MYVYIYIYFLCAYIDSMCSRSPQYMSHNPMMQWHFYFFLISGMDVFKYHRPWGKPNTPQTEPGWRNSRDPWLMFALWWHLLGNNNTYSLKVWLDLTEPLFCPCKSNIYCTITYFLFTPYIFRGIIKILYVLIDYLFYFLHAACKLLMHWNI